MKRRYLENKRAWLKIVEAFTAILLIMSVLLVIQNKNSNELEREREKLNAENLHSVVDLITQSSQLRAIVLGGNETTLYEAIANYTPRNMNYTVRICNLGEVCSSLVYIPYETYSEDATVSANLTVYNPKLAKIFFWEGPWPDPICDDGFCQARQGETENNCAEDCTAEVQRHSSLLLRFSGTVTTKTGNQFHYTHIRTFTETGGIGVTLTEGQICYLNGNCDAKGEINYVISKNDNLVQTEREFSTIETSDKFTLKYWGVEEDGSTPVYVEQNLCVLENIFAENCE